jgi:hypothetical protein
MTQDAPLEQLPDGRIRGRRIHSNSFAPGDYGKGSDGIWRARAPDVDSSMGSLEDHTITEHEDGTITVSPSLLLEPTATLKGWHGYLERGIWKRS